MPKFTTSSPPLESSHLDDSVAKPHQGSAAPELLTAVEVGSMLKCSRSMVYKLQSQGNLLPRYKIFDGEKGWRWSRVDVLAFINRSFVA
jgi:hypothetical protein